MARMEEREIRDRLGELEGWQREGDAIRKRYRLGSFAQSLEFVNRVGALAEAADHHPDIDIRFDQVELRLSTHSAGGLTSKDFDLAMRIDEGRESEESR